MDSLFIVLLDRTHVNHTKSINAIPVISPKSNRIIQRDYNKIIYKERNFIHAPSIRKNHDTQRPH